MIKINDVYFGCELSDILIQLQNELHANGSHYLAKIRLNPTHIQVTCPYHSDGMERKPSAGIRKSDGMFHCFACNTVRSLPEVISHCFDKDDGGIYGMQWLLRHFSVAAKEESRNVRFSIDRLYNTSNSRIDSNCGNSDNKSDKKFITEEELDSYRYTHPYILNRGISESIVELFDVGWDKNTDSITFPNLDKDGNCLFVAKRSIKQKYFQYPPNVQKELYGVYQLYKMHPFPIKVYVCESMIDSLYLWTFNKPSCALNGLGNELQFKQLRELPCRTIVLATDMDEAGLKARERIRMNMQNTKIIKEVFLPKGRKDINECTADEIMNLLEVY